MEDVLSEEQLQEIIALLNKEDEDDEAPGPERVIKK